MTLAPKFFQHNSAPKRCHEIFRNAVCPHIHAGFLKPPLLTENILCLWKKLVQVYNLTFHYYKIWDTSHDHKSRTSVKVEGNSALAKTNQETNSRPIAYMVFGKTFGKKLGIACMNKLQQQQSTQSALNNELLRKERS